ncbi:MAG: zinc ribbon domain-containing protein [Pseudomonadota bacterium]|nr:MAG: FmdB family transcriptional regulator [Pseudomonadota bacterium]
MPVYEYLCAECGPFTVLRAMEERGEPHECPACLQPAPRVLLSAPALATMPAAARAAHAINERAAHEPKRAHGPGCGCCGGTPKPAGRTALSPDGRKSFPGARPWMISH